MSDLQSPWERLPGEPARWYTRFERYRLAGPSRSLLATCHAEKAATAARRPRCVPGAWAKAAQRWRWKERAEAWDAQEHQRARQAQADKIRAMNERHAHEARGLQAKALERLRALRPEELKAADVARFLIEATKLERLALGEPDTVQRQELTGKGGGPLQFSLEDAVAAARELEEAEGDSLQREGGEALLPGSPEVP
jgi:hypothetical protein